MPDRLDLASQTRILRGRLRTSWVKQVAGERRRLTQTRRLLLRLSPQTQIDGRRQQVNELGQALARQIQQRLLVRRLEVESMQARLPASTRGQCCIGAMQSFSRRSLVRW